ncbi:stimulator of interferon genes protein homolog [Episyrphus balteatus]|uniref:stimulator of interferon genes protein homolog n=1 Tax=Episyrphus balteatus TaxID=286459 RepID=UPI002484EA7D|nr:stimulator of interferon genes protein homolog [Episyrphus balteatus]
MLNSSMTWGKNATFAAVNLILAELIWRIARIFHEYRYYSKHYPFNEKFRTICRHGFTFNQSFLCLMTIIGATVCTQFLTISLMLDSILEQIHLLPIWWILRFVQITKSAFDYADFIRSDSGLDYATGMASNYFHGYLNLTLPKHDEQNGIKKRIENYASKHDVEFAVKRLMILIPNSLHTRPVIESPLMERQDKQPLEGVRRDRAGVSRPYINDVYRILIDEKPYYITVEGATPLLSYFDALNFYLTSTWQMKAMQKEIMIKFYRYLKNILEKWPATQEQCELVFYNDYTADGRRQDVGEVLCLHIKNMWENNNRK